MYTNYGDIDILFVFSSFFQQIEKNENDLFFCPWKKLTKMSY